ncbi:MAG: hypothetical protein JO072_00710, partial [Parafilimonas sp.]|nr:hypothetical protein [Parafilimonas sp.]
MIHQGQNMHAFYQWYKLNAKLRNLYKSGMTFKLPFKTFISLYKKWKRYLRKLITAKNPWLKTFNICCIATGISATVNAQCNVFSQSDVNNPIKKIEEARSLFNACFIDIDNDGDLDCYENYVDEQSQLHFTLLRNIGT